jgi:hypothetical protein
MGGESFTVELRAMPDEHAPPHVRLRQLLKIALRGLRLRCTSVCETTPKLPDLPPPEAPTGGLHG